MELKRGKKEPVEQLVNTQFGASKASCLHLAAKEGHRYVCLISYVIFSSLNFLQANGDIVVVFGCRSYSER